MQGLLFQWKSMSVKFKKQKHFPYLQEFKQNFPITENTIFVFDDTIYADSPLPDDIIIHEIAHLKSQQKIGAKKWIQNYILDEEFRLEEELIAYKAQLKAVKELGDRQEYAQILIECSRNISSNLYGNLITKQEFIKKFSWKNI